jgi:hypothetical protein
MTEHINQQNEDSVSIAIQALEAVVDDKRLSKRTRFLWRKVLIEARRLAGVQLRRGRPVKFDYRQIHALAESGKNKQEIAELLGCSIETVRQALRRVRECATPPLPAQDKGNRE